MSEHVNKKLAPGTPFYNIQPLHRPCVLKKYAA